MKSDCSRYSGYRFPSQIISYAVWAYHRFCLSFRDVEEHPDKRPKNAAKVRDAVKRCVDTGREQRVALLYCVERVAPLLDGCVGRKALAEEAEELFKGAERTEEKIAGQEFERLKFKGGRSMVASRRSEVSHLRCP